MSDSKQGWMRGAAVAGLVLVGGLGWQVVNLNQALTESEAAYDRLATEARAALEEERERGRQAVLEAEARGRRAADDAVASARKARKQGSESKKGRRGRKERTAPSEDTVPGAGSIDRIYMSSEKFADTQQWDDATYDAASAKFDIAFDALDVLVQDVAGGMTREEAKIKGATIRSDLMAGLSEVLGEERANSILESAKDR